MELISGKTLAAKLKAGGRGRGGGAREKDVHARLAVVIVGRTHWPAGTYVAGKAKDCAECGLLSDVIALPEETTEAALLEKSRGAERGQDGPRRAGAAAAAGHIRESASSTPSRRTRTWTASPQ